MERFVILENIRSKHNVGSIFRTADAAGVSRLYLTGYTPTPIDRFGRRVPEIVKTALSADDTVSWEKVNDTVTLCQHLQQNDVMVVAVEQAPSATALAEFTSTQPTAFVFGNEVSGVSREVMACADVCVEIPMRGNKESLNVAVAAGVVLFHT